MSAPRAQKVNLPAASIDGSMPPLADLLEGYREEIVGSWVGLLCAMEGLRYRARPVTELQGSTRHCLDALVTLFRIGSHTLLDNYSEEICARRAEQGFDISEVIEGHLLLSEAVLPIIQRESGWGSDEEPALRMASALDAALRRLVIRFSKLYSQALNQRLQSQVAQLEAQRKQLERRVREVSALVRSSALITENEGTLDIDKLLSLILAQLAEVVQYDRASIQLVFEGRLRIIAGNGFLHPDHVLGLVFDPRQNALSRRMLEGEDPIVLQDVRQEPDFVADPDDPTRSWIGVPLKVRNNVIGALALDKKEPSFYDEEDGQTVLAFANQAAIAIENAKLYDRSREQDILQERNRLARELHDSLSQSLFSMVLNAEAANLFFDTNPDKAKSQINLLYETANSALKEMRTLIFELRPANLEQEGLAAVLRKHAKQVGERNGVRVRVDVKGQGRLASHIERALYRVAQEALNNIVKHAQASEALVALNTLDNRITMTIEDDGVGIEGGASKPSTLGLTSMREIVEQLHGTFEIGPRPEGRGTLVRVTVPCEQDE
ncbi:MAG: histidine kinase [Chloroflexota bacterium]|nr:histidine kinase [Chloroflexota bacterium]